MTAIRLLMSYLARALYILSGSGLVSRLLSGLLAIGLSFATPAFAVDLIAFPDGPAAVLPIDEFEDPIPCDQIATRLNSYGSMANENYSAVNLFVKDIREILLTWYKALLPLEGKEQLISKGTFSVLSDGARKVDEALWVAEQNTTLLAIEMGKLVRSLEACSIVPKK